MNTRYAINSISFLFVLTVLFLFSCNDTTKKSTLETNLVSNKNKPLLNTISNPSQEFKDYWYVGQAEITSYTLEQARYGELRNGHAVLIFVTEDFLANKQVKADDRNSNNISVLKLNATKKFNTGIYPYSVMHSTFYPVSNNRHAIKLSSSIQEWCGHVYTQLNNRNDYEVISHSYFESEGDNDFHLKKEILENELWTQLRINPSSLPQGEFMMIPSLEFTRFKHIEIKAYSAIATLTQTRYSITYPELNRTLSIDFNNNFPHEILSWEESFKSGFGPNTKTLTTKATKLKTIRSAYWGKNSNADEVLRDTLQLK